MKRIRLAVWALAVLALAGVAVWWLFRPAETPAGAAEPAGSAAVPAAHGERISPVKAEPVTRPTEPGTPEAAEAEPDAPEEPAPTPEEKAEAEAEAKVESFDNLTDKWMEPSKAGVSMKDIDDFAAAFRRVPKDRKDECIHRALNLIPDENVMLLAGILMDKSEDKAIVETVFNDILNRDEDVKKPILKQIFDDKSHPCWADTAWILDVTGEKSAKD